MFDDRIDLTFYVDAQNYLPIRAFEFWKEYITGEGTQARICETNIFYRMNYVDDYALESGIQSCKV